MKDELGGKNNERICCIKRKNISHSYLTDNNDEDKRAKGPNNVS